MLGGGMTFVVVVALGLGITGASAAPTARHLEAPGCEGVTVNAPPPGGDQLSVTDAGMAGASPLLEKANAAHVKWATNVSCTAVGKRDHRSKPAPLHSPKTTTSPSSTLGSSTNWSGYDTDASTAYYAQMEWYQPTVSNPSGASDSYSCIWPGIGGENGGVLVQAGTEADRHSYLPGQTDYFWYEVVTSNSSVQTRVNGVSVTAGDDVGAAVSYNQSAGTVSFTVVNFTAGTSANFSVATPHPSGTAEWIVERTEINGNLTFPYLANFGTARVIAAYYNIQGNGAARTPQQGGAQPITMYSQRAGSAVLSSPNPLGANNAPQFTVTWHSPGI
ncbi:hypothetical protein GCM10009820_07870 [Leifsonia soli]